MRVLGIDPGIGRTGWGIVETQSLKLKAQGFGCIETFKDAAPEKRLQELHEHIRALIKEYNPEILAIEDLFFNKNVSTALIVGQARGVILLAAAQCNLPVAIYTPLQVKVAVTGYGRADKRQVGQMIKTLLKLTTIPKLDDTADALAIAITHAFSAKLNTLQR